MRFSSDGSDIRGILPISHRRSIAGWLIPVLLACGGDSTTQPSANPVPSIATVSPLVLTLGSPQTITVTGAGFLPTSLVRWDGAAIATALAGATTLTAQAGAQAVTQGAAQITVTNPPPGGGVSNAVTITVHAPLPVVTSINPGELQRGANGGVIEVLGSGFFAGSTVHFNGLSRSTTLVSAMRLSATILPEDLATAGTFNVTVVNPPPGGGASGALPLVVAASEPVIIGLPSQGAAAGAAQFDLAVDGSNFQSGVTAQWNGSDRPTIRTSDTRLRLSLSAADLATPGPATITATNPGAGPSNGVVFNVRALPGLLVTGSLAVDQRAADIIWDSTRALFYASVPAAAETNANSIVAVDPLNGVIAKSLFVGDGPEYLEISDNGQFLYVALLEVGEVQRINLATFSLDGRINIGATARVEEMRAVPGSPNSLVVSKRTEFSPRYGGVFVYDGLTQRGAGTPLLDSGANTIAFDGRSPGMLYGFHNETTNFFFWTMAVTQAGVQSTAVTTGLIDYYFTRIFGAAGRIYGTDGSIIDPELRIRTGRFSVPPPDAAQVVSPAPKLGLVFFLREGTITAYDMNSLAQFGSVAVPGTIEDQPAFMRLRLVAWGSDGLAYRDSSHIRILRTSISAP